jgi:hypothetical protein
MSDEDHIKLVVGATIAEIASRKRIKFAAPTTILGWVTVIGAAIGSITILWSTFVIVDDIVKHKYEPHHKGVASIITRMDSLVSKHSSNTGLHIREPELKLAILEETTPIKEDIGSIKEDVSSIKTKIDILISRGNGRN